MFKLRKYAGISTVEALLWLYRADPLAAAQGVDEFATGAGTVSQILFIAFNAIFRANVCMHGVYDIDTSSAERETTHYGDSPNGLPHGRNRLREEPSAAL